MTTDQEDYDDIDEAFLESATGTAAFALLIVIVALVLLVIKSWTP